MVLGSPRLLSGIPGEGSLQTSEVKVWLANPDNHKPLEFILPAHLRSATGQMHVPADNPLTRAKIELGRQLFFDKRLGAMSCADCHQPRQAYSAHQVFPDTGLSPLAAFNRIFGERQFWNGKAASLEDQPRFPVQNVFEMETTPDKLVAVVRNIEGYRLQFEAIFGEVSFAAVCKALACFQRALVTGPSAYDLHQLFGSDRDRTKKSPSETRELQRYEAFALSRTMSKSALRGERLFFSDRIDCGSCHSGANFSDEDYHNLGAGWSRPEPGLGRFLVTKRAEDKGAFKTPTLRN